MSGTYGSKSIWKWIMMYVVIGGLVYGAYYYFAYGKTGTYQPTTSNTNSSYIVASPRPSVPVKQTNAIEEFLGGKDGMTLYTFSEDKDGVSTCYDSCATTWPPYINSRDSWPPNYSLYTRKDGLVQVVYKGKPLYYYKDDVEVGDMLGHEKDGLWYVAEP